MREVLFEGDGLVVSQVGPNFYVRYDVRVHQIVIREDQISAEEATRIMLGRAEATRVLFELQQRLTEAGIDAYTANT